MKTVLYAEDDDINFLLLQTYFVNYPEYTLQRAVNGKEAINAYTSQQDSIDLIFMDLKMPVMNGVDATKHIRAFDKDVPIICSSAHDKQYLPFDDEGLFTDYLPKPIRLDILDDLLQKYL